ncbi:hypothetical protein HII36_32245 [Nonomuraea sp. NN258]|uniref:hypothetical protein n=1 Tax=Nonomuraea antri TaxID=2730852 RepID=UPI0015692830|nr:hypothetical protein [Nonomuraea antri]NRQ36470.1 hypothetical protein [Nonomuraea antri]
MNVRAERDLPAGRHRLLKEFVMTEIDQPPRRNPFRLRVLAPLTALAAAAAVAVPLLLGGPAYALTRTQDGLIHITINEAKDPDKLQADLRAMGANVVVTYIPTGKKCSPQPRADFLPGPGLSVFPPPQPFDDEPGFVIDPGRLQEGQTGVLEFSVSEPGGSTVAGIWDGIALGPVTDCALVDTTEAPLSH